jgi:hypothetical protein
MYKRHFLVLLYLEADNNTLTMFLSVWIAELAHVFGHCRAILFFLACLSWIPSIAIQISTCQNVSHHSSLLGHVGCQCNLSVFYVPSLPNLSNFALNEFLFHFILRDILWFSKHRQFVLNADFCPISSFFPIVRSPSPEKWLQVLSPFPSCDLNSLSYTINGSIFTFAYILICR